MLTQEKLNEELKELMTYLKETRVLSSADALTVVFNFMLVSGADISRMIKVMKKVRKRALKSRYDESLRK